MQFVVILLICEVMFFYFCDLEFDPINLNSFLYVIKCDFESYYLTLKMNHDLDMISINEYKLPKLKHLKVTMFRLKLHIC